MSRDLLAPQQRTDLSRLAAPVGLPQDRELVLRREPTATRPLDELRVGHRLDVLRAIGSLPLAYGSLQRTDRDPIACVLRQFVQQRARPISVIRLPRHDQEAPFLVLQRAFDGEAVPGGKPAGALVPFEDV
jgi:hypothetical protein